MQRIRAVRKRRIAIISIGIVVVVLIAAGLVVNFTLSQFTAQKEYNQTKEQFTNSITSLQDQLTVEKELLDNTPDDNKDIDEYIAVDEISRKSEDLLKTATTHLEELNTFNPFSNGSNVTKISSLTAQIENLVNLAKEFTNSLNDRLDVILLDQATVDLKEKITAATVLASDAKLVLGNNEVASINQTIKEAADLISNTLTDEEKVTASTSLKPQIEDMITTLTDKINTLQEKYDKKKGTSKTQNSTQSSSQSSSTTQSSTSGSTTGSAN